MTHSTQYIPPSVEREMLFGTKTETHGGRDANIEPAVGRRIIANTMNAHHPYNEILTKGKVYDKKEMIRQAKIKVNSIHAFNALNSCRLADVTFRLGALCGGGREEEEQRILFLILAGVTVAAAALRHDANCDERMRVCIFAFRYICVRVYVLTSVYCLTLLMTSLVGVAFSD